MKRKAIIQVTYELLSKFLELPEGIEVEDIIVPESGRLRDIIYIKIKGGNLPEVLEGEDMLIYNLEYIKELYFGYTCDKE